MQDLTIVLQALVAASIFFVWVVRYDNIIQEFSRLHAVEKVPPIGD